jgi:membrane-associated protease RseP (regulator of RpoE activity)
VEPGALEPFEPEPVPARKPGRLVRLLLRVERMGWRANLALLLLTLASTFAAGDRLYGPAGGLRFSLAAVLILGTHEMGHTLACRAWGVSATLPFFLPKPLVLTGTFGAVIRIREPIRDRNALFDIGVAGPLAGFAVLVPVLLLGLASPGSHGLAPGEDFAGLELAPPPLVALLVPGGGLPPGGMLADPLLFAAWFGLLATAMNLLPAGQLDGGHVAYSLSPRLHRAGSRAAAGLLAAASIYSFAEYGLPFWIVWLVVLAWMGPRHPPLPDDAPPLSPGRRLLAVVALAVFLFCFTPAPVH